MTRPTTNIVTRCPECGSSLATGLADGLCPACLLGGLDAPDELASGDTLPTPVPSPTSLLAIPGYRIVAELARGGMGIVYRARQQAPDREVALKMLLPFSASSEELRERFRQEARTLTELDHPAILPIYETGEHDGLPWFSMKLATGGNLADRAPRFFGRWREIAELIATLADAVQFAHGHGVLHRDLKPGNILFDSADRPFVADFGLAKLIKQDSDFTRSQRVLGTPHYVAPEVAASSARHATTASDVYSLGAIFFELLTGRPPFEAEGLPALLKKIVEDEPTLASPEERGLQPASANESTHSAESTTTKDSTVQRPEGRAPIPGDLKVITLKCLAKDPAHRYGSARELAEELRRFLAGEPILARAASPAEKLWRWSRRKPALASALAACALILIAGVGGILWQLQQTEAARAEAVQKARDEQAQRTLAETARAEAERSERVLRQNLYAADMPGAQRALDQNDLTTARKLLAAHRPSPGQEDLRGFEWRHLWAQSRDDSFAVLTNHGDYTAVFTYSPDGAWLAFGRSQVFVCEAASLKIRAQTDVGSVQSLAFTPDGQTLLIGDRTTNVLRWDWQRGQKAVVWFEAQGQWPRVEVSPGGDLLAVGCGASRRGDVNGTVALYDATTGDLRRNLPESGGLAAFSPDGKRLATGSWDGTVKLWDPMRGEIIGVLSNAVQTVSLGFSPDGQTLAVCGFAGGLWLYDVSTGARRVGPPGPTLRLWDAAFAPDGVRLATGGFDQTVRVWDLNAGTEMVRLRGHSFDVTHVAWSPRAEVLTSSGNDGAVRLWNVASAGTKEEFISGWTMPRFFSSDGRLLAAGRPDDSATLYEFPSLKVMGEARRVGWVLGFLPDSNVLLTLRRTGEGQGREVVHWAVPDFQQRQTIPLPGNRESLTTLRLSHQGRFLAEGLATGEVRVWDFSTPIKPTSLSVPNTTRVNQLDFSPDDRLLAALFEGSTSVHLWDVLSGQKHSELRGHPGYPLNAVFTADGRTLLTGGTDKQIKLWDVAGRKELTTLTGHREGILALQISPDGKTLASAGNDFTLHFWNLPTRRELARFTVKERMDDLTFAPDGSALLLTPVRGSGSSPSATTLWRAPDFAETDGAEPSDADR